jgi:valyl-tRNA synthetase
MKFKDNNTQEIEEKWKKYWEKEKIYQFDFSSKKPIYSIDTPPPTVSGKMHIGHAFSYSQQDFIARFNRMNGKNIFFPFGTDDNGLPTERLIEKIRKIKSKELSRKEFIEICLNSLKEITPNFIEDWKKIGISSDFNLYYSTIDKNSQKISQKSFLDLYKKGEIYKKEFPVIWCPECQTAIAQAELEDKEFESQFSTIKFDSDAGNLFIATTRPELLPACVAIFVSPEDKRYKKFLGKKAKVPLFNFEIPIIGDESANPEKGTGAMMVCSYGDKFDVEAIFRHKLTPRIILNKDGTLNFGKYKGIKIKDARKEILNELKEKNLIQEQKSIKHIVNVHDRCGTEIEFIPADQWFIKILDKKKKLIELGKEIEWHPKHMMKRYMNWIKGLDWDWNISRNRHFGIPIPIWYCKKCGEIVLPEGNELPVDPQSQKKICPKCGGETIPEEKVLDTWATSSLTPQIAKSLTKNRISLPYSLRPQAHDILRTWTFYTIVKSYLHEKKIPWKNIMISGFVRLKNEKMSKSKGNVINPEEIIEEYGSDALRFWAAGSNLGEDLNYQEKDLISGKRFITKLQNATKFVFMNLEDFDGKKPKKFEEIDKKFLLELDKTKFLVTNSFENYNYSKAKADIENFFWKFFCDFYLEFVKKRVYNSEGNSKKSAQYVLYQSLLSLTKMIAPIMPFITEELYQNYFKRYEKEKSVHLTKWPKGNLKFSEKEKNKIKSSKSELDFIVDLLTKIRKEKTTAQKPMNSECIITLPKENYENLKNIMEDFRNVTNASEIKQGKFGVEFI